MEAVVRHQIPRRALLAAAPLALAGCRKDESPYFGNTRPPDGQSVVSVLDNEPASLDPALSVGIVDSLVLSLFEGLTSLQPTTGEPMAALATHYEVTSDGLRYAFYLRGHSQPRGFRLPATRDLPLEFSRGRSSPPDSAPARWSDGAVITAHDFVYSWRRALEPALAAEYASLLYPLRNAREINRGQLAPHRLGVRALDDFTLQADLLEPTPYFLELVSNRVACAVPRHIVEAAGRQWTDPGRMVSNGAFTLRARRPYDSIVLVKNPNYYDSGQVALNELTFLVTRDLSTLVNEYRSGAAMQVFPWIPAIMPLLRKKKDFRPHAMYASDFVAINTKTPPFDDVCLRYALNMATDKRPIAETGGAGNLPARGLVPPDRTYQPPQTLPVTIDGTVYDVLSYNPKAARELLSKVRKPIPRPIEYLCPADASESARWILRDQWRANLGIELAMNVVAFETWLEVGHGYQFRHLAMGGSIGSYRDPAWFLDLFTRRDAYGLYWNDPAYASTLAKAKVELDPSLRGREMAQCERHLLEAMPIVPVGHWVNSELESPSCAAWEKTCSTVNSSSMSGSTGLGGRRDKLLRALASGFAGGRHGSRRDHRGMRPPAARCQVAPLPPRHGTRYAGPSHVLWRFGTVDPGRAF